MEIIDTGSNQDRKPKWGATVATIVFGIVVIILLASLLGSCVSDDDTQPAVGRVLLVYLAGDNNLSGEARRKLDAIASGFDGAACRRVLVYIDSRDGAPSLTELSGPGKQDIIERYDTENSADASVFRRVIGKAKSLYPEATFNLLVFSHASGWLPGNMLSAPKSTSPVKSILVDGETGMELADFAAAIPDHCFESIVFEACYTAGIEVFYELKDKARYIAGSSAEIVSPGFTPLYSTAIVNDLVKGNVKTFLQSAFEHFDSQQGVYRSATLSLIETAQLEALAAFVKSNCDFSKQIDINNIQYFDRGNGRLFPDFEDYYSRLLETDNQKEELKQLVNQCTGWKASTPFFMAGSGGFAVSKYSGMTGYISQGCYPVMDETYKKLGWKIAISK